MHPNFLDHDAAIHALLRNANASFPILVSKICDKKQLLAPPNRKNI